MIGADDSHLWLLLAGLAALGFGAAIWLLLEGRDRVHSGEIRQRFAQAFGDDTAAMAPRDGEGWLENLGQRVLARKKNADSEEVKLLLARAGWKRRTDLAVFYALQTLLPVLAGIVASYTFWVDGAGSSGWANIFLACGTAWLLPKRIVAYLARARQKRVAEQTLVMVHLLRVLLSTGLSVEQSLRSLVVDTLALLPDLAVELRTLLQRIDIGEDIGLAMRDMANGMDIPELTDLSMILEQTWRMGGNVTKSLSDLSTLIDERRHTGLKEKVSKLSGQMTIVMMVFLFPALLVFLAAPGFLAIARSMKHALG
ncbi:type II secretion system F domain protein [Methylocaldum marinum]|uniref:Type II secretion system F domain protein n=2 Tax=Methylocaldum marinum TaxID=1432792 RepID=A0A250KLT2_9GAMM|nr:type II secretion system F domain protein [Methylocaldum marinum]